MSDAEDASGFFTKATEILRESTPVRTAGVDVALGRAKAKAIREISDQLCRLLENGGALETIDKHAKVLGMEVLGVQQMTLQARKRTK